MTVEDKKLALKKKFLRYIHPLKSITNNSEQKECWIEQMTYLVKDFKTLINLPFKQFWSTVVYNKEATVGLCSFLQEAAPPYLIDQLPQDDNVLNVYYKIYHFAYLLINRLTTSSENEDNYMSPHHMWGLLYNNNIINIPMLFDICSVYGQSHKKELEIIFKQLFSCQKAYNEHLKNSVKFTIKCLSQFQDKIELDLECDNRLYRENRTAAEIEETNIIMIEDIINFLLDTSYSISNFLEIYPNANSVFYQEKLHYTIASFYHNVKPIIYKKVITMNKLKQFEEKLHASRLLLVKSVQQCLTHLTNQIIYKKGSDSLVEEYLEAVTELLQYNEFLNDYNVVYNLIKDIQKCQKTYKQIDATRYDYILKSLELINASTNALEQKELHEQQLEQQVTSSNLENAKLQSLISDVKDLLPHLGNGFIQKCLEFYDMDSEKVINMVLEDCLPPELTQYDFNLPVLSEYDMDINEDNTSSFDTSIKGNRKFKKLKAVLDDKSFRNEMRPFYEQYNFTEVTCAELESYYDDEYDDTYDEVEYVIPEPADENEKRRPDVVPRVLTEKKVVYECVEEFSDEEPQQVLNFQPFCENPEEVRERQARRYASKQLNRSNRSKPKGSVSSNTPSGSNVELDRQRKNENKAFHGNHNRRNAARNKQQKGMF